MRSATSAATAIVFSSVAGWQCSPRVVERRADDAGVVGRQLDQLHRPPSELEGLGEGAGHRHRRDVVGDAVDQRERRRMAGRRKTPGAACSPEIGSGATNPPARVTVPATPTPSRRALTVRPAAAVPPSDQPTSTSESGSPPSACDGLAGEAQRAEQVGAAAVLGVGAPVGHDDRRSASGDQAGQRRQHAALVRPAAVPQQHVAGARARVHVGQAARRVLERCPRLQCLRRRAPSTGRRAGAATGSPAVPR